jgi:gluconolactonase
MFSSIKKIEAVLFARLPDEWRVSGRTNEWLLNQPAGHAEHSLLEGPVFGKDGYLYCVDVIWGRVFRVDSSGNFSLFKQYDGEPNGLKVGADGSFYIADFKNGILKMDAHSMEISTLLNRYKLERFKGANDLTFAKNGDLFFTDQGLTGLHDSTGRVFRMRKNGNVDCILNNVPSPNGLVLHPGQKTAAWPRWEHLFSLAEELGRMVWLSTVTAD